MVVQLLPNDRQLLEKYLSNESILNVEENAHSQENISIVLPFLSKLKVCGFDTFKIKDILCAKEPAVTKLMLDNLDSLITSNRSSKIDFTKVISNGTRNNENFFTIANKFLDGAETLKEKKLSFGDVYNLLYCKSLDVVNKIFDNLEKFKLADFTNFDIGVLKDCKKNDVLNVIVNNLDTMKKAGMGSFRIATLGIEAKSAEILQAVLDNIKNNKVKITDDNFQEFKKIACSPKKEFKFFQSVYSSFVPKTKIELTTDTKEASLANLAWVQHGAQL
jgi:hypothetical protein